jgi:Cytochrome B6-F complex subunit VI (PetL)
LYLNYKQILFESCKKLSKFIIDINYFLKSTQVELSFDLTITLFCLYIEGSHMVTVFSYIGLLIGALVATLTLYIGLLKIKLI